MWKQEFKADKIVALQNRASDLWEASTKPEDHEEYIAIANRLLGALEMFWSSGRYVEDEKDKATV